MALLVSSSVDLEVWRHSREVLAVSAIGAKELVAAVVEEEVVLTSKAEVAVEEVEILVAETRI